MYVDCKKGFENMFNFKLIIPAYDQDIIDKFKQSIRSFNHVKKEYFNRSSRDSVTFKFSDTTESHLNTTLITDIYLTT